MAEIKLGLALIAWGIVFGLPLALIIAAVVPTWCAARSRAAYLRAGKVADRDSRVFSNRRGEFRVEAAEASPAAVPALGIASATPAAGRRAQGRAP